MWLVNGFQSNEMSSIHKHIILQYTLTQSERIVQNIQPIAWKCTRNNVYHAQAQGTHAHNRIHPFKYTISYTQCVWMNDENSKLTSKQATHLLSSNTRLFTSVEFSFSERQGLRKFSLDKLFPGYKRRWDDLIDKEKIKYSNKCSI